MLKTDEWTSLGATPLAKQMRTDLNNMTLPLPHPPEEEGSGVKGIIAFVLVQKSR